MRLLKFAAILLIAAAAGCGGNSTAVSVTITPSTANVFVSKTQQFSANVSGASATGVYWQICLPAASASIQPTNCTAIPGITLANPLTGYGTITQTGLYTAPSSIPAQNNSVVMATSIVNSNSKGVANTSTDFGLATVTVDSGVRVQITPLTPTIGVNDQLQFAATVTGTTNQSVSWTVKTSGTGVNVGTISASGLYTAPSTVPSGAVTVEATAAADPTESASTTVTISGTAGISITSIHPSTALENSVQQDVYIAGTNFFSTDTVLVGHPPAMVAVPTTFISGTLLRATIPASQLAPTGSLGIQVTDSTQPGVTSGTAYLTIEPSRPAIVASAPRSVPSGGSNFDVILTGGHFGASTGVEFNGQPASLDSSANNDSRHLSVVIPSGSASSPGLYPVVVTNSDAASVGAPSTTAANVAVQPASANIPTSMPVANIPVGTSPSAVAIDKADGIAVVVNSGDDSVSVIDLNTYPYSSPAVITTITGVGSSGDQLTSVAVDDLLADPMALVVDSTNQTVVAIDLTTQKMAAVSVSIGPIATSPVPYSIGVNPMTHRAIVTYQSTNQATILDVSTGTPVVVQQVGGVLTHYSTGVLPAVAIDPQLNWAVVTPGGSVASTNLVDLGTSDGRTPQVIGSLSTSATVQGVAINPETHQALLTDPNAGSFISYSLLDNAVNTITFRNPDGSLFNELHFVAAATNPLADIGVAVDENSGTAAVVDLAGGTVIQKGIQVGNLPEAIAVDPGKNLAVVANQSGNSVTVLSLGSIRSVGTNPSPQIIEINPSFTYTSATTGTLTIIGAGFVSGSQVFLDGTSITVDSVSPNEREIVATISAGMLGGARRYAVTVQNPANGGQPTVVSNASALTVAQAVVVGSSPVGVAVDRERDLAVVSNSVDGTVSLIALSPNTPTGPQGVLAGAVGTIGPPIAVGVTPQGVATLPREGLAVVANFGSSNMSFLDVTETNGAISTPVALCSVCSGATGIAIDEDTALAVVTNSANPSGSGNYYASIVTLPATPSGTAAETSDTQVDQIPTGVAVDPNLEVAAIAASQTNSVDLLPFGASVVPYSSTPGLSLPAGVAFDSLNQVFLLANSLDNGVVIMDPMSRIPFSVRTGINPTSVDYDFQTSTLLTFNSASGTVSVLDYFCPPVQGSTCPTPQVRTVIGLGESLPPSATPIGPNAIAIDSNLDIVVLVDQGNNRVLLVPLPY
jgi:DNA-binding beta-propeller fold protein YncE